LAEDLAHDGLLERLDKSNIAESRAFAKRRGLARVRYDDEPIWCLSE
jgi:hypothetical protein